MNSTNETVGHSSETGLSRIQLKGKISRNDAKTLDRSQRKQDIITNNLEPNEIRALRVANPLHHAFNNHLGKVITSV
jgi:hypothetical protein